MLGRTASIGNIKIHSLSQSAIVQIGDSKHITPTSRAIAVQQKSSNFTKLTTEEFEKYEVFHLKNNLEIIDDNIFFNTFHEHPCFSVNCIQIKGIAASGVFHAGNTECIISDSRVKHIRDFSR
ncbi:MAG: spore germination protein GerPE [Bacillales bacterium]|jgi:spore germination protein PE|nr:spore germination protein GerPE [Bacillales bacterium]